MERYKTQFGEIEVDPETVIVFPSGMPGLPECKRFKLLHEEKPSPLVMWLQSLDDADVYFNVIEAERLGLSYQVTLSDEECLEVEMEEDDVASLLLIISKKESENSSISANTQAPIVLNVRSRKALQKTGVKAHIVFSNT